MIGVGVNQEMKVELRELRRWGRKGGDEGVASVGDCAGGGMGEWPPKT